MSVNLNPLCLIHDCTGIWDVKQVAVSGDNWICFTDTPLIKSKKLKQPIFKAIFSNL